MGIFAENVEGEPPSGADLAEWAAYYELSYPILSDPMRSQDALYDPNLDSRPTLVLIDRQGVVQHVGRDLEPAQIEALL